MEAACSSQSEHRFRKQLGEGTITTQFLNFPPVSHSLISYFVLLHICQHADFPSYMDLAPIVFVPKLLGFKRCWKELSSCCRGHMSI